MKKGYLVQDSALAYFRVSECMDGMNTRQEFHVPCCMQAALAIAMVCFGLDFVSLFFGLSIFMMKVRWQKEYVFLSP